MTISLSCVNENNYLGHWRCDRTGIARDVENDGTFVPGPISTYYDRYDIDHYEFLFKENGDFEFMSVRKNREVRLVKGKHRYSRNTRTIILDEIGREKSTGKLKVHNSNTASMNVSLSTSESDSISFVFNLKRVEGQ